MKNLEVAKRNKGGWQRRCNKRISTEASLLLYSGQGQQLSDLCECCILKPRSHDWYIWQTFSICGLLFLVVGTAHLCQFWLLVLFPPTVGKYYTRERNHQCHDDANVVAFPRLVEKTRCLAGSAMLCAVPECHCLPHILVVQTA